MSSWIFFASGLVRKQRLISYSQFNKDGREYIGCKIEPDNFLLSLLKKDEINMRDGSVWRTYEKNYCFVWAKANHTRILCMQTFDGNETELSSQFSPIILKINNYIQQIQSKRRERSYLNNLCDNLAFQPHLSLSDDLDLISRILSVRKHDVELKKEDKEQNATNLG